MDIEIKICGIKRQEDIEILSKFPVNYAGFIFANSKRKVTPEHVVNITKNLRSDIKKVGVFVNEDIEKVNEIIRFCNLDVVQLHGEESDDYCSRVDAIVWKSISVKNESSLININHYRNIDGFLLDTYTDGDIKGGTGKTFNWDIVKNLSKDNFIILAGGLNKDNIVDAIKIVKPNILDVNSGVETELVKDEKKIKELFSNLEKYKNSIGG